MMIQQFFFLCALQFTKIAIRYENTFFVKNIFFAALSALSHTYILRKNFRVSYSILIPNKTNLSI